MVNVPEDNRNFGFRISDFGLRITYFGMMNAENKCGFNNPQSEISHPQFYIVFR
jgi:hypothetical protein